MPKRKRVYEVWSTYQVTGVANIVASSAAEAARIGVDGYEDGCRPQFEFSDAHHETKMRAKLVADRYVSPVLPDPSSGARHVRAHEPSGQGG